LPQSACRPPIAPDSSPAFGRCRAHGRNSSQAHADHLGFEDPAYFSRFFNRRMSLSPREFRVRDALETEEEARR
jgi:AraC-like DNA-binding protein